jgi:hypothetical protein
MLIAALRLTRAGKPFSSAEALRESIRKSQQPARDRPPAALGR